MQEFFKKTIPSSRTLFLMAFVFVLVASLLSSYYIYKAVTESEKAHMYDRAQTIAQALDQQDIISLQGNKSDISSSAYARIKTTLENIRFVNSDIRFVYILGLKNGDVFFKVDSEPVDSVDYSPPGQVYDEATPFLLSLFEERKGGIEGPETDRWGTWISALAPLKLGDGTFVIIGIDVVAKTYIQNVVTYSIIPIVIGLTLLILLISMYRIRSTEIRLMKEKEAFLAVAAHEIRSPLTGIRWATEQLIEDVHKKPIQDATTLSLIYGSAVEVISRINNLLSFERIQTGAKKMIREEVNMYDLIKQLADSAHLAAVSRNIKIQFDEQFPKNLLLFIDREKLRSTFANLISNALKYTNKNSTVKISYQKTENTYDFSIHDEGDGLTKEEIQGLFVAFERTVQARLSNIEGTGLGLAISKEFVDMHKGTIRIISEKGKGSTFIVSLPQSFV